MPYKDYEKQKENSRQNYWKNRERKLERSREYYYENWKAKQEQRLQWIAANPDKVKISRQKYAKKWYANPETKQKSRAYNKVRWALKTGKLVKSRVCEKCLMLAKLDAHHHNGYSDEFALNILWLCKKCHEGEHHEHNSITRGT